MCADIVSHVLHVFLALHLIVHVESARRLGRQELAAALFVEVLVHLSRVLILLATAVVTAGLGALVATTARHRGSAVLREPNSALLEHRALAGAALSFSSDDKVRGRRLDVGEVSRRVIRVVRLAIVTVLRRELRVATGRRPAGLRAALLVRVLATGLARIVLLLRDAAGDAMHRRAGG